MSEKTEKPTPNKIRKAREEGQIAHSKDLTQIVLAVALLGYLMMDAPAMAKRMGEMLLMPGPLLSSGFEGALKVLLRALAEDFVRLLFPLVLLLIVLGLLVEMSQTGMLFAFKSLKPSGKKLNVVQNVKNMFGKKGLVEFAKSLLKILVLTWVVSLALFRELPALLALPHAGAQGVGISLVHMLKAIFFQCALAYAVIAIADFFWQRHFYTKQQMMSIDEVRREYREQEGDPHQKQERKQIHRDMLQEQAIQGARSASVLVTNPIHLAIAVRYRVREDPLPMILAKGQGELARRMVAAARREGVPVLENVPLAWDLMRRGQVDQYIPKELIIPVAEVLRWVRSLKNSPED